MFANAAISRRRGLLGLFLTLLGVAILFVTAAASPLRAADPGGNSGNDPADQSRAAAHSDVHATTTTAPTTTTTTTVVATSASLAATTQTSSCDPNLPGSGTFPSTCDPNVMANNGNNGGPGICAGCVGSADNKSPGGQTNVAGLPSDDANSGYECDANSGIARTNPAHSGCVRPASQVTTTTAPPATTTTAPTTTVAARAFDVSITKSVDKAEARPGDPLLYTVTVTNTGRDPLTGVFVTDAIPSGTTYVQGSASPAATFSGNSLRWDIGNLAVGASRTMTFSVTINADAPSQVVNVAVVRSNETPPKEARATTVVTRVQGVVLEPPTTPRQPRVMGVQLTRTGAALTMMFQVFLGVGLLLVGLGLMLRSPLPGLGGARMRT